MLTIFSVFDTAESIKCLHFWRHLNVGRPTSMYGEFTRQVLPLYPFTDPKFMICVVCCKKTDFPPQFVYKHFPAFLYVPFIYN